MKDVLNYLRRRLAELDALLRGDATRPGLLAGDKLDVSARGLAAIAVLLAMFYGASMGSFSLLKETPSELADPYGPALQVLASTIKTPALFALTLVVTLPSLYVFNALVGSRLTLLGMTRLLVAAMAVNAAVLASLGAIVLFFSLTTKSYPFVVLLNVAAFTVAGVLGLTFLLQTLHRLTPREQPSDPTSHADDVNLRSSDDQQRNAQQDADADDQLGGDQPNDDQPNGDVPPGALDMPAGQALGGSTRLVFRCWIVLFSLVGAQMGWVLRPFVGNPDMPFTLFRERESNFFAAVLGALHKLLIGD